MALNPYNHAYRKARAALLASAPLCVEPGCGELATTADHVPPVSVVGPHLNLVPKCAAHNFADGGRLRAVRERERLQSSSREW